MSFDRRITPARADLADERLRGTVEAPRYATGKLMRVVAPSTPLRPHPSPEVSIDTEALMGDRVQVYDEHEGYLVAVAERCLGVPYLWGGKTSLGLDCSGLIQLSLAAAGIEAPRDTDMQQAALGEPVDLAPDLSG